MNLNIIVAVVPECGHLKPFLVSLTTAIPNYVNVGQIQKDKSITGLNVYIEDKPGPFFHCSECNNDVPMTLTVDSYYATFDEHVIKSDFGNEDILEKIDKWIVFAIIPDLIQQ